jgi:hypothetical protein
VISFFAFGPSFAWARSSRSIGRILHEAEQSSGKQRHVKLDVYYSNWVLML